MLQEVKVIEFPMQLGPIRMGTVNCYLVKTDAGFFLIDTAFPTTATVKLIEPVQIEASTRTATIVRRKMGQPT